MFYKHYAVTKPATYAFVLCFCLKRPAVYSGLPLGELLFLIVSRLFCSEVPGLVFPFCFLRKIITVMLFGFSALLAVSKKIETQFLFNTKFFSKWKLTKNCSLYFFQNAR